MTPSWRFTLPSATPSLNTLTRTHWAVRARDKVSLMWQVKSLANRHRVPRATGPRRLTITRMGKMVLDQDNLAGGCKDLIDVLKNLHLVLDDNPEVCSMVFHQVTSRSVEPHTVITLEDIA